MSKKGKTMKSIAIIILLSFGSKFLGFIRESLIADNYGSNINTDTYFIAISAITLFTSMIVTSINYTLIPVLSEVESIEGKKRKVVYTNNLLNIIIVISIILMILAWVISPVLIKILAPGFMGNQFELALLMVKIGIPAIIFASVQGVFRGYLQSEMKFTETALADLPFNVVYIIFLMFISSYFDIKILMVVSVLATASQIIIQLPALKKSGFSYMFIFNIKDKYVKNMLLLIPPVLISASITNINRIVDKSMASNLIAGSISALQYAERVNDMVRSTFVSAITTVVYPLFSENVGRNNLIALKKNIIFGLNIILFITIPATIGIVILSKPIVQLVFERGEFDALATYMTAGALVFYSIGIVATSMRSMVHRVFYSLQDTRTPMINSFIALGVNIIFNIILIRFMGHNGIALATSISAIVTLLFLIYKLRKKIGSFGLSESLRVGGKISIASLIMGIIVFLVNKYFYLGDSFLFNIIELLTSISVGIIVYLIFIYLLKINEFIWLIGVLKRKVGIKD